MAQKYFKVVNAQKSSITKWSNEIQTADIKPERISAIKNFVSSKIKFLDNQCEGAIKLDDFDLDFDLYNDLIDACNDILSFHTNSDTKCDTNSLNENKAIVKLPKLEVPPFSSNIMKFSQF